MFYLLKCNYKKKRGLFSRLFSSGIVVTGHRTNSVNYCIAELSCTKGIEWNKIVSVVGKNEKIVLPQGVTIPENISLQSYPTENAVGHLIAQGALQVIEKASQHNHTLSVMLIDKSGKYTYLLTPLIRCAQTVTAVTASKDQYEQSAQCLLDTLGAFPVITDDTQNCPATSVIIAPDGISGCGALPLPTMIFAPRGWDFISVQSENINLGSFGQLQGYNKLQLAAAILDSKEATGQLPYAETMLVRGKNVQLDELAQMLI